MIHLLLDAAFPPSPQQWIDDMNAVGANGGFVYVYGPYTNYTSQHVTVAKQVGKTVLPIIVPGNTWPANATLESALQSYGFNAVPAVVDLEPGSEPSNAGLNTFAEFARTLGYVVRRYGTSAILGTYSPQGEDWIAQWIRTGILNPLPTLPAGEDAWQFVNDIVVNGNTYDASIVDDAFITGGLPTMWDPTDPNYQQMREAVNDIVHMLADGQRHGMSFDAAGNATDVTEPTWPFWLGSQFQADQAATAAIVNDVKVAIANLQVPPADLQPVTDLLNKLSTHLGVGTA